MQELNRSFHPLKTDYYYLNGNASQFKSAITFELNKNQKDDCFHKGIWFYSELQLNLSKFTMTEIRQFPTSNACLKNSNQYTKLIESNGNLKLNTNSYETKSFEFKNLSQVGLEISIIPNEPPFHPKVHFSLTGYLKTPLLFPMSKDVFVDPFELNSLYNSPRIILKSHGNVDLEAAAYNSNAHVHLVTALVYPTLYFLSLLHSHTHMNRGNNSIQFTIPLHSRYQSPKPNSTLIPIWIQKPWIYSIQDVPEESLTSPIFQVLPKGLESFLEMKFNVSFPSTDPLAEIQLQSKTKKNLKRCISLHYQGNFDGTISIPIGNVNDLYWISMMTYFVIVLGIIMILIPMKIVKKKIKRE